MRNALTEQAICEEIDKIKGHVNHILLILDMHVLRYRNNPEEMDEQALKAYQALRSRLEDCFQKKE